MRFPAVVAAVLVVAPTVLPTALVVLPATLPTVEWVLDCPIANSGRLAQRIRELGNEKGWNWNVETVFNPDAAISKSNRVVISSDSHILDGTERWLNFNRHLIDHRLADSWLIDLSC